MSAVAPIGKTAPQMPLAPTLDQIREAFKPRIEVFNPSEKTETIEQYGDYYVFPANHGLPIRDKMRYITIRDKNPKSASDAVLWTNPKAAPEHRVAEGMRVEAEAAIIAAEICRDDRHGKIGFCVLFNDGRDEERKHAARQKWLNWRLLEAQQIEGSLVQRVTDFQRARPGMGMPQFRRFEVEALRFLDRYTKGEYNTYVVGAQVATEADVALFLDRNPAVKDDQGAPSAQMLRPEVGPEAPGQAEPPDDDEGEDVGVLLLRKAKAAKVKLTAAELEGLLEEDSDAIEGVARKIARAGVPAAPVEKKGVKRGNK